MTESKTILKSGFILLAILASFFLSSGAWGINYYVDASNGNKLNTGTSPELAWKTVQYAANVAQAGDTVNVKTGTYNERVKFVNSGNSENKITFKSSPRRSATVNGGFEINKDHIHVEGFNITIDYKENAVRITGDYAEVVD
ncbi:hypothetical protein KA005_19410, partial [bacterium]|nr:hypothetical protein [bacterium]